MSDSQLRPVAAAVTLSLPAAMALTVARMSTKLSKVLNGTFSLSQYETRSKTVSRTHNRQRGFYVPRPAFANSRSVSFAAERSDTPSPA
jgi:hypothetical protein